MIFAAFFVSFPRLFRFAGTATVTKCTLARACENAGGWGKREGKGREKGNFRGEQLERIALVSPLFLRSPSPRAIHSLLSFDLFPPPLSRCTLNHKYKSQEHRESIVITNRTRLFCFRNGGTPGYAYIRTYFRVRARRMRVYWWYKRKTFAAYTTDVPSVKSIFPFSPSPPFPPLLLLPRRFIRSLSTTKEFSIRNFTDRQTESSYIPYSVAITWLFMISSAIDNRIFPFWLTLL